MFRSLKLPEKRSLLVPRDVFSSIINKVSWVQRPETPREMNLFGSLCSLPFHLLSKIPENWTGGCHQRTYHSLTN